MVRIGRCIPMWCLALFGYVAGGVHILVSHIAKPLAVRSLLAPASACGSSVLRLMRLLWDITPSPCYGVIIIHS